MHLLDLCFLGFLLGGLLMYALPDTFSLVKSKDEDE